MTPKPDDFHDSIHDQILAWLEGEMEESERAEFEQLLREDDGLRSEVERWREALAVAREWTAAEPPGAALVDALPIPKISHAPKRAQIYRVRPPAFAWLWHGIAAAGIFFIGLLIGRDMPERTTRNLPTEPQNAKVTAGEPSSHVVSVNANQGPAPAQQKKSEPDAGGNQSQATAPPIQTAREENGKIIIETSLSGSGTRALWIVDGGFQIASAH